MIRNPKLLLMLVATAVGSAAVALPQSDVPQSDGPEPRLTAGASEAQDQPAEGAERLTFSDDLTERMVLAVDISGRGFRFIVDTGAERTSISRELAAMLALTPGGTSQVHSMTDVARVGTFLVPELRFGARQLQRLRAPAFARSAIGADGMLGADALQNQRVLFDFGQQEISIEPSQAREELWPSGTIVVTARRRLSRLVLVDAVIEGHRVWVILDTGSQVTIGNAALERLILRPQSRPEVRDIAIQSVTGGTLPARYTLVSQARIGGVTIHRMPLALADAHPFRQLDLVDRPALLLGMDTLRLFDRVSVDFGNRRVRLLLRDDAQASDLPDMRPGSRIR